MRKIKRINFDYFLLASLVAVLLIHYVRVIPLRVDESILAFFASIATLPVMFSAYRSIRNKKISVDLLASIALIASLLNGEWASAVFINLMLTSARIFSAYTESRSRRAIKSLLKLRPEKVKVKRGEKIIEEPVSKIKKGDLVVIELGDRVPVDGIIINGQALIDQSSLTGESIPINKKEGDEVFSSTLNTSGSLIIRAEKVGEDTTLEKIVKLVEQSQSSKIAIKTTADKFTSWYISITIIGTVALYLAFRDLGLVLTVLLVTCADDIAVAIPMAFSAAIGSAAKKGIIVKGGEYFEGLAKAKTILVDKTGTITKGKLRVENIFPSGDFSKEEVLKLAAIADCFSEHPIAKAIIDYAKKQKIGFDKPDEFKEFPGRGSTAVYKNKNIICGRHSFLEKFKIPISQEQHAELENIEKGAGTVLAVSYSGKLAGYIELADEVRPEAKESIAKLKELGVRNVVMLTGDNEKAARKIAEAVGIDVFHADLLPQDKLEYVKRYIHTHHGKVAMIGDGVNDAASLALSDVGIAMGVIGTDTAIEAADIALMKDDFSKIPRTLELGRMVVKVSQQDFWIWGFINVIGLVLALSRTIGPEGAAAFNFITDFIPLINSLRLFGYKFSKIHRD